MKARKRGRELGLPFEGRAGKNNAITDVTGVLVGYSTLIEGDGPLVVGKGPVRTGVTAILPRGHAREMRPVWAGFHALNGNGEMTGVHWINHAGHFYGPVCITNTHSVGVTHAAATWWMIRNYAGDFLEKHIWALPVVAETYDGRLNDINGQHVREEHVLAAIDSATDGAIAEGNVGGGTGMIAYEFKGGTGTASQVVTLDGEDYTVGVLVQANHGLRDWLTVLGVPVGRQMRDGKLLTAEQGSIIVVIATDIPLLPHQLQRVAQRASIGISKTGTPGGNSSGDIFLAFSTANSILRDEAMAGRRTMECIPDEWLDPVYMATVRAVDESIVNAMLAAEDMSCLKPDNGSICKAIDPMALLELVQRHYKSA
ncbi:MAG: P1 family peptidase [Rhizobiales bacterium]|nr:P1 family peptidase [Hyphomicrobiales bacterium]OJX98865.1 MAG: aminopeptidase [Rhizobiales bacterium 63-22]